MLCKVDLMRKWLRPNLTSIILLSSVCISGCRATYDNSDLNVFPFFSRLLIFLCGLSRLLVIASDIIPQLPPLDEPFDLIFKDSALLSYMANVTMVAAIICVVRTVCQSLNVRRNGENPQMFILSVDRCDRYNGGGVLTEPRHLIILRSLVPVVISIPNIILFSTSTSF